MPKGYQVPFQDPGTVAEQLLGSDRETKTYIEDGSLAMFLGMFRSLPESWINIGRRLHAEEHDLRFEDVSPEDILRMYPEARECIDLHQRIIGHKGSQGGYLVDRYTGSEKQEEMKERKERKESSGEGGAGSSRWA